MLRYLTAGESHGQALCAILEGMPAGLNINENKINHELARRQKGYGRGGRMSIETDQVKILSGLRKGQTIGAPISLLIYNRDFKINELPKVLEPRPGHADLAGLLKYDRDDARDILERSSARETAIRVAVGAVVKIFLKELGIDIGSHVIAIGPHKTEKNFSFKEIKESDKSLVRCCDKNIEKDMIKEIDSCQKKGLSLGGIAEVVITGVPVGLGSYVQWDRRLDARLACALMSIQAIKGVEIGNAFENSLKYGSDVHDEIFYSKEKGYFHKTNRAGGIEGGMSNGEDIILHLAMKPIPTQMLPLRTVNIQTKKPCLASKERSDVCAVPAAGIVAENVAAIEIANAFLEKFGGDSLKEILKRN